MKLPDWKPGMEMVGKKERWILGEPVGKWDEHVWFVTSPHNQRAVIKRPRHSGHKSMRRFYKEVRGLRNLNGTAGVLPMIDQEPGEAPTWFVMPEALSLVSHLASADFRETVEVFAILSDVLAGLAERPQPVAHRDIKPDNLFWYGGPVFGDFGIAAWFDGPPVVTKTLDKVGPVGYIAPELMNVSGTPNWHAADVYSLAKSFWSVASFQIGKAKIPLAPPQGPILRSEGWVQSLRQFGGAAAKDLDQLFEDATSNTPNVRPTAAEFRDDLQAWLRMHPGPTSSRQHSFAHGLEDVERSIRRLKEIQDGWLRILYPELRRIFGEVNYDYSVDVDYTARGQTDIEGLNKSAAILDQHGRHPEDEWDGAIVLCLIPAANDLRVIIGAVVEGAAPMTMDLISEVHRRDGGGGWRVTLIQDSDNLRPGRPVTIEKLRHLLENIKTHAKTGSPEVVERWECTRIL